MDKRSLVIAAAAAALFTSSVFAADMANTEVNGEKADTMKAEKHKCKGVHKHHHVKKHHKNHHKDVNKCKTSHKCKS